MSYESFHKYHPIVNFLYFASVLLFAMALKHPLSMLISFVSALLYAIQCDGKKALLFTLKLCLPMFLLTALINPLFNHEGVTILYYFKSGLPLTLESIVYGLCSGGMLVTILVWFISFNKVFTSEKTTYLFGKIIPAMSLVLNMTLRFIPRFKHQLNTIIEAQRSLNSEATNKSLISKIKFEIKILSIMLTWSFESAIETADSMKSRGYGLKGRTTFSPYRLESRDKAILTMLLLLIALLVFGMCLSVFSFDYFPVISKISLSPVNLCFYFVYFALCILPVLLNILEDRKWKSIHSNL